MLSPDGGYFDAAITVLLAKSDIWQYEHEFRIVAQERMQALGTDTLMTDNGFLQLPKGTLVSVIVGCQGNVGAVQRIVDENAPGLQVRRAVRVPDRYEIRIEP